MIAPIQRRVTTFLFHAGQHFPISGILAFDTEDPYAVTLVLNAGTDAEQVWTFARDLLHDGAAKTVGDGDVQVRPVALFGRMWRQVRLARDLAAGQRGLPLARDRKRWPVTPELYLVGRGSS